ncbi:MAG: heme biosynthesis HemY N-terminal domain-containing protein [Caulobacterales bacterium]
MVRLLILLILLGAAAIAGTWVADRPGSVDIEWLGYKIETTTFFFLIFFAILSVALAVVWGLISWLLDTPRKIARVRKSGRLKRGRELFAQGFLAAEGGDAVTAKALTAKAERYLDDPRLMGLLTARAAEASGDNAAAERAYVGLMHDKKAALLARRGLSESAARRRDYNSSAEHAAAALEMSKSAAWAFNTLYNHKLAAGDWKAALAALDEGEQRKFIGGKAARRRRAVILTAAAAHAERRGDRDEARDFAQRAVILAPGFAPAAALSARLYFQASDLPNAERTLESAWQHGPHPALSRLYADLRATDALADRTQRLLGLADLNPGHRESRILRVEQRIDLAQWEPAQNELELLIQEGLTSRLCSLMAAVAKGGGDDAAARDWLVLAATAPREPDWSDIEPEGLTFAYTDDDWERLAHVYGDGGQMIHPRYERFKAEAFPAPSVTLLPMPARIGHYADAAVDFSSPYARPQSEAAEYARLVQSVDDDEIHEADGVEDADFDEEYEPEEKKRSVLSWFSRRG